MASLLFPVSNLTNLLLAAHVPPARFAAAARRGVDLPPLEVVKVALWLVPAMLVAGLLGLWAVA